MQKNPHTIAEDLILPVSFAMVYIMVKRISNNKISRGIHYKAENWKARNFDCNFMRLLTVKKHTIYIYYVRFLDDNIIVEDFLFYKSINEDAESQDLYQILDKFIIENKAPKPISCELNLVLKRIIHEHKNKAVESENINPVHSNSNQKLTPYCKRKVRKTWDILPKQTFFTKTGIFERYIWQTACLASVSVRKPLKKIVVLRRKQQLLRKMDDIGSQDCFTEWHK